MSNVKIKYWVDYVITATLSSGRQLTRRLRGPVLVNSVVKEPYLQDELTDRISDSRMRYLNYKGTEEFNYLDVLRAQISVQLLRYERAPADILVFKPKR